MATPRGRLSRGRAAPTFLFAVWRVPGGWGARSGDRPSRRPGLLGGCALVGVGLRWACCLRWVGGCALAASCRVVAAVQRTWWLVVWWDIPGWGVSRQQMR